MQIDHTLDTRTVERTATISLVRAVDFDALAANATDGAITVDALQNAGDFVVVVTPNGRDAKQVRHAVADEAAGRAWLDGFVACNDVKAKGKRKPKPNGKAATKSSKATTKRATK